MTAASEAHLVHERMKFFTTDDAKTQELSERLTEALGDLAGHITPITNARARRISLRLNPAGHIVLVRPKGSVTACGGPFCRREAGLDRAASAIFAAARTFPRRSDRAVSAACDHVIRHMPEARRGVWCEDGVIYVSGRAEHVGRRVRDWMKAEAKRPPGAHDPDHRRTRWDAR